MFSPPNNWRPQRKLCFWPESNAQTRLYIVHRIKIESDKFIHNMQLWLFIIQSSERTTNRICIRILKGRGTVTFDVCLIRSPSSAVWAHLFRIPCTDGSVCFANNLGLLWAKLWRRTGSEFMSGRNRCNWFYNSDIHVQAVSQFVSSNRWTQEERR